MKSRSFFARVVTASLVVAVAASGTAFGQITGIVSSDVEGYFGTTSDAFQLAEGPTIPPWAANGPGFYPIFGLPNVPPLYPGFPNPILSIPTNISYAPTVHFPAFGFSDGTTTATYSIVGGVSGLGTSTGDAYTLLGPPSKLPFIINQPPTASGYAYEQVNFATVYSVGAGGLAGGTPPPRPYLVAGNLATGGYAQFAAEVNYWFLTTIPGTVVVNSTTFLGSLQYNAQFTNFTGNFSTTVNYAPTTLLGATGNGFLVITGDAFVAGDPFSLTVQAVPEPSTLVLGILGACLIGIACRLRLRRTPTLT